MGTYQKSTAGFTMIEAVLVLVLIAVMGTIAIPRFAGEMLNATSAIGASRELSSDMRLCRSMAIANAGTNPTGYALKMIGTTPYPGYELVDLQTATTLSTKNFPAGVSATGDDEYRFGPLGNLLTGSGTSCTISGSGKHFQLTVTVATGSVIIQEL
jgi:type II secretory pathway pseudopilin PulG